MIRRNSEFIKKAESGPMGRSSPAVSGPHRLFQDVAPKIINSFQKKKNDIRLKNMYKYPSNIKLAHYHKNSNKLGKRPETHLEGRESMKIKACPCCENIYVAEEFEMGYPTFIKQPKPGEQKFQLQIGVSLYFTFVKMVIYFLLIRALTFDIVNIWLSSSGHFCSNLFYAGVKDLCSLQISGYNLNSAQDQPKLKLLDIISFGFTIISIIFLVIFRKIEHTQKNRSRSLAFSQEDFSVLIENVPTFIFDDYTQAENTHYNYEAYLKFMIQNKIKKWLGQIQQNANTPEELPYLQHQFLTKIIQEKRIGVHSLSQNIVTSISLCYDLSEMENIFRIRQTLLEEHVADEDNVNKPPSNLLKHIPNQIDLLNKQYIRLCENYVGSGHNTEIDSFKLTHFTGKAFISFQYQHYRDYFIRQYISDYDFFKISGKSISVNLANKPNDVYWYNMKVTDQERSKATFYAWAVLVMLLTLSLASLIGIELWHISEEKKTPGTTLEDKIRSYIIAAIMALLTTTINYVLSFSIEVLSGMQKHKTKSDRMSSLMVKTLITQSINTCFIYIILYFMQPTNPLGNVGLVNKVISLIVISGLIDLLLNIFIPKHKLLEIINRCRINDNGPINMFQIDLNRSLQLPEFQYSAMYSFYIVYGFVVAFYGFLAPGVTYLLILFYFLHYWIDKYNLFRRFSSPVDFSFELRSTILSSFELSVFFFAAGYFMWDLTIHFDSESNFRSLNLINLIVASIYCWFSIFTSRIFKNKILKNDDEPDIISYSEYMLNPYNKFAAKTFYSENPATSCLRDLSYIKDAETTIMIRQIQINRKQNQLQQLSKEQQLMKIQQTNLEDQMQKLSRQQNNMQARLQEVTQLREQTIASINRIKHQSGMAEEIQHMEKEVEHLERIQDQITAKITAFSYSINECERGLLNIREKIEHQKRVRDHYKRDIEQEEKQATEQRKFKKLAQDVKGRMRVSIEGFQEGEPDPQGMFITQQEVQAFEPTGLIQSQVARYSLEEAQALHHLNRS